MLEAVGDQAKVVRLAVREIPRSGPPEALIEKYGISSNHIVAAVKDVRPQRRRSDAPKPISKRNTSSEVRLVVEVDGNPVGFLSLDLDALALINHRKRDMVPVEWMDPVKVRLHHARGGHETASSHASRDASIKTLGDEMVKAELDWKIHLKAEAAAQAFGRYEGDIEKLVAEVRSDGNGFLHVFLAIPARRSGSQRSEEGVEDRADIPPR